MAPETARRSSQDLMVTVRKGGLEGEVLGDVPIVSGRT
jgi:hypothetical protein